ncbi:MAG: HlyC/CorC family transporter [Chloroflexi bacterium]|nr:HlyC/CorC family transporter [Chloroflexota bacterium]RJR10228.1 MAG: HlyC/CorC family transporter [Candidatus Parcubacteria bacterium]
MFFEILILSFFILMNGLFSMSEIALISAKKNRLQAKANKGSKKAVVALDLSEHPNRFLSTIQIGITLIGTLSGAFGGATIAKQLSEIFSEIPWLDPYSDILGVGIVVLIITYLSLVIGELVPKRIALDNSEKVAIGVAPLMHVVSKISSPFVTILSKSTDLVIRMLGIRQSSEPTITEEDLKSMLFQGRETGVIEESEQNMVERIFRLSDRDISAVMTPRTELVFLSIDENKDEILEKIIQYPFSRFPVFKESYDDLIGIVDSRDLLLQKITANDFDLPSVMQKPSFLPETTSALDALEYLRSSGIKVAVVIDEYGGVLGMAGMNDIVRAIIGNVKEPDITQEDVVLRDDGSWLFDGMLQIDELKEYLGFERLPEEEDQKYETLSGLMMTMLNRIPLAGDYFDWNGYRFEVMDMDGRRVDKVMVIPPQSVQ